MSTAGRKPIHLDDSAYHAKKIGGKDGAQSC